MSPTFEGLLGCVQIRIFSAVMLECASSLEGIPCFVPPNCLSESAKSGVEKIIVGGLETILKKAKTRKWNGKMAISMKTQNIIDPYLAALYNTYSLSAGLTDPYQDCTLPPPQTVKFTLDTTYIAEGENDCCKLEVLHHDKLTVVIFTWKEFNRSGVRTFVRHNRTTWNFDASRGSRFDIEYYVLENRMKTSNVEMDKIVGWPSERRSIDELLFETKLKMDGRLKRLKRSTYKWIKHVPEQYLKSMDIDLDKINKEGSSILHNLAELNEYKNMECLMDKTIDIDTLDKYGQTPLHRACASSSFKSAKLLIQNGANVNLVTKNGDSPLMLLASHKKQDVSLIKMLVEFNAKRCYANKEGMRAIDFATMANAKEHVKTLLKPI